MVDGVIMEMTDLSRNILECKSANANEFITKAESSK